MDFIFRIQNHYFEKGSPWVELDKIKQRSWFLSVDIEDDEAVPCYGTVSELRLSKGSPWVELDKIKQRSWFLSVDIEDDEAVPCYGTVSELRLSKGVAFKSVKILTSKTQETHPYWEALLDMSYTELRDVTFNDLPNESGIYSLNIWFGCGDEELSFGDKFKKLCELRHKWDDGWVCSKCGVRKADWVKADIKTAR